MGLGIVRVGVGVGGHGIGIYRHRSEEIRRPVHDLLHRNGMVRGSCCEADHPSGSFAGLDLSSGRGDRLHGGCNFVRPGAQASVRSLPFPFVRGGGERPAIFLYLSVYIVKTQTRTKGRFFFSFTRRIELLQIRRMFRNKFFPLDI